MEIKITCNASYIKIFSNAKSINNKEDLPILLKRLSLIIIYVQIRKKLIAATWCIIS